jgi:hypothetical protein
MAALIWTGMIPVSCVTFHTDSNYTNNDRILLVNATRRISREVDFKLKPFIDVSKTLADLKIEFTDSQTPELKEAGAIGIATLDKNVNMVPNHLNAWYLSIYSGTVAMELTHSLIGRLTKDRKKMNDVIHYLYNGQRLSRVDIQNKVYNKKLGGNMRLVIPDIAYGWKNQDRIIDEIRKGVAPKGKNPYWTKAGVPLNGVIMAHEHEVEHIIAFLTGKKLHH